MRILWFEPWGEIKMVFSFTFADTFEDLCANPRFSVSRTCLRAHGERVPVLCFGDPIRAHPSRHCSRTHSLFLRWVAKKEPQEIISTWTLEWPQKHTFNAVIGMEWFVLPFSSKVKKKNKKLSVRWNLLRVWLDTKCFSTV